MEGQTVLTPEGEQALVDRVFEAVTAKLEVAMDEAIKVAREETSEQFKETAAAALELARSEHLANIQQMESAYKHGLDQIEAEATRRMAHATEQVKEAVKEGVELEKRVDGLRGRLSEIAKEAEASAKELVGQAVAEVASTATKYKTHVDAAGSFLTTVKNEQERIAAYVEGMLKRGLSPEALDGALKELERKMRENLETIQRIQGANRRRMDDHRHDGGNRQQGADSRPPR
jgi:hypothetical protein